MTNNRFFKRATVIAGAAGLSLAVFGLTNQLIAAEPDRKQCYGAIPNPVSAYFECLIYTQGSCGDAGEFWQEAVAGKCDDPAVNPYLANCEMKDETTPITVYKYECVGDGEGGCTPRKLKDANNQYITKEEDVAQCETVPL